MIEGLILLAVIFLYFLIRNHLNRKYVLTTFQRANLLPVPVGSSLVASGGGDIVLRGPARLKGSIEKFGLTRVLEVYGVIRMTSDNSSRDNFFRATITFRHTEGLHPVGNDLGAIAPSYAATLSEEKKAVKGDFFLSAPAFQYLLDACEANIGVEHFGTNAGDRHVVEKNGILCLLFLGPIFKVKRNLQFDTAFFVRSIGEVSSHFGTFIMELEDRIAKTSDVERRKDLVDFLSWANQPPAR